MEHLETYKRHFYKIVRNAVKCKSCGDVVESTHRHDFRACGCGSVSVDGGTDYLRRSGDIGMMQEMCETRRYTLTELIALKTDFIKQMRQLTYSEGFYKNMIAAAVHYADEWYGCKI